MPQSASRHHGARAEPVDFLASLPDFPLLTSWHARRGFASLIGERGHSGTSNMQRKTVVRFQGRSTPAVNMAQVRVAVAKSREEIEAAKRLVRERYEWRGYEVAFTDDLRAEHLRQRFAHEITIVAAHREATIGTVTLGLDGPIGLARRGNPRPGDPQGTRRTDAACAN